MFRVEIFSEQKNARAKEVEVISKKKLHVPYLIRWCGYVGNIGKVKRTQFDSTWRNDTFFNSPEYTKL